MSYTTFSTRQDGPILTITLNNGETNIMSAVMAGELFALVGQLAVDTETRALVIESAVPDFFVAHFAVKDILKLLEGDPSVPVSKVPGLNVLQALGLSLQSLPQVTIAKVDGICRGGGFELMLALDMCFATDNAKFCFPEAASGFLPSGGGATLLPLKAGHGRALEVMTTGRDFSGQEAACYGFINQAFENAAALDAYVSSVTAQIGKKDLAVIQAIKSVSRETMSDMQPAVLRGLAQENTAMAQCLANPLVIEKLRGLAEAEGVRDTELDLPAVLAAL